MDFHPLWRLLYLKPFCLASIGLAQVCYGIFRRLFGHGIMKLELPAYYKSKKPEIKNNTKLYKLWNVFLFSFFIVNFLNHGKE